MPSIETHTCGTSSYYCMHIIPTQAGTCMTSSRRHNVYVHIERLNSGSSNIKVEDGE